MPLPLDDNTTAQGRLYVSPSMPIGDGGLPVAQPVTETSVDETPMGQRIIDRLLGTNGQERYQLWPEKLVRDALSAPHDVLNSKVPSTSADLIKPALDMSALAGTGGLAGVGEGGAAALGSSPFLRPALKYEGKIYKAPMGGQHMDAIPKDLQPEFTRQAMSGEDISNFNFGFMNHKGQFLDREKALKYAIDEGLMSPHDAKYGALTSTMEMAKQPSSSVEDYMAAVRDPKTGKISSGNFHADAVKNANDPKLAEYFSNRFKNDDPDVINSGFVDKNGNYLSRVDFEKKFRIGAAEDLPINETLDSTLKYGALTSTLMADSSKEAAAIDSLTSKSQLKNELADIYPKWKSLRDKLNDNSITEKELNQLNTLNKTILARHEAKNNAP